MNKLRALYLNVNGWSTLSKLPAPFASGIAALLAAPRFRHLSLNGWSLERDISDFRSTLSPCLATLESLSLARITETNVIQGSSESKEVSVLQLDRLRTLEIYDVKHPLLEKGLQCPNLECLLLKLYQPKAVVLPPCIPTRLTKLLVHAHAHGLQPVFGETFCPSEFHQPSIEYPTPADYAALFTFLEELGNLGQLQRADLNILVTAPINMEPDDVDGTREVEQLKNAFAPLLEAGVMEAELVVQRWAFEYGRYEVVTQLVA
ncbi:hypothetical protein EYR40_001316 [Pleurotus pulmonarius]|nr:hypothetical protein EYR38_004554 [Pleurotus pulmonarius]KAF4608963.1 hypothetical protein EYR40_001316 [Pleurotus pulmonarius]